MWTPYNTVVVQRINQCICLFSYHLCNCAHNRLGEFLVVIVSTIDKVPADFLPKKVAIHDWLVYFPRGLVGDMVLFCDKVQVLLNATCSLERCNIRVEVGLKEKWDAGICQGMDRRPR